MAEFLSFSVGVVLIVISLMVMKCYWPSMDWRKTASGTLGVAIFLGFFAAGMNTFWWQILGNAASLAPWITRAEFREIGLFMDLFLKGTAAFAGVLHLIAVRMRMGEPQRSQWAWFEVPWYPQRRPCLRALSRILDRSKG